MIRPAGPLTDADALGSHPARGVVTTGANATSRLSVLAPAVIFLATRLLDQGVWVAMSAATRRPASVGVWDGAWYLSVAVNGYLEAGARRSDAGSPFAAYAFFPALPVLVRPLVELGIPLWLAPLLYVLPAGVVFAYGVARLARLIGMGRRGELIAVTLISAAPLSIVFQLAYPEALLAASSAWALVGVLERRWILAATATLFAGLTRPTAVVLIVVVVAAGLACWWQGGGRRALWVLVAPLGYLGYVTYVAIQVGRLDAYSWLQERVWNVRSDGGLALAQFVPVALTNPVFVAWGPFVIACVLVAVGALVATRRKLPLELWVYAALIVFLAVLTSGVLTAKPRQLLMAYVLLLPLALWLDGRPRHVLVPWLISFVLIGSYLSAYGLTVFRGAI